MTDTIYAIADLQAMPNYELNMMAAELRGYRNDWSNAAWYDEHGGRFNYEYEFKPATDRNQSGELLEWLADKGFTVSIGRDQTGETHVGISHSDYGRIGAHDAKWPRAESIAFCAAMLAMVGRLQ